MTPAEEQTFIALWQQGASYNAIAQALGCSLGTVASRSAALVAKSSPSNVLNVPNVRNVLDDGTRTHGTFAQAESSRAAAQRLTRPSLSRHR
jgi:hypothetical protein